MKTNRKTTILRLLLVAAGVLLGGAGNALAQESDLFSLRVEGRVDYLRQWLDGDQQPAESGFKGRYLNLLLEGRISSKFDFSYRQRLNRAHKDEGFFDATDWIWLQYRPTERWSISAGKQVVLVGGWEYDRSPIDLYFCSEFWNNFACYQMGASVSYHAPAGHHSLTLQACQSPFDTPETDLYAFNFLWNVSKGCYHGLHSLNASQYADGKYVWYLALGNRFTWGDACLQVDWMNRHAGDNDLLSNFSLMGEFSYLVADRVNLFAKVTYDRCASDFTPGADLTLWPGSELTHLGGGVEYYPLGGRGDRSVRLHAVYSHTWGTNLNPGGTLIDGHACLTVGATWRVDLLKIARKLIRHE